MAELHNPAAFYAAARRITAGKLSQVQTDTITGLLAAAAAWPIGWVAYGLATGWHESYLAPRDEIGKGAGKPYGKPGARSDHTTGPEYGGQIPYGRGLVQLTWCDCYEWADHALALNGALLADFELANRPDIATRILVAGMEHGRFTGKKLADYITVRGTHGGFVQARRIINGQDKAEHIALAADQFQDALDLGGWK